MHFIPPINLTPQLQCPSCGQRTPKHKPVCVHCGRSIPQSYRNREKAAGQVRRRQAKIGAIILVPLFLLVMTWVFQRLAG